MIFPFDVEIYKNIFDELNQFIIVFDTDQTVLTANSAILNFTNQQLEDVVGVVAWELPWWNYSKETMNEVMFRLSHVYSTEMSQRFEVKHYDQDCNVHEVDYIIKPVKKNGNIAFLIAMGYNITEMVQDRKALTQRDKQIKAFFDYSNDGYFFFMTPEAAIIHQNMSNNELIQIFQAQRITSVNEQMSLITGIEHINHNNVLEAIGIDNDKVLDIWRKMLTEGTVTIETSIENQKTHQRTFLHTRFVGIFSEDNHFDGNFCIVQNITKQYLYQKELNFLANKDTLTGLNNRRNFHKLAEHLLQTVDDIKNVSIGMMDIDHFKKVNDTYGHDVGDIVISTVAELIDNSDEDIITGRYGGEEFIIIGKKSKEDMEILLNQVRSEIQNRKIQFGDNSLMVTISSGISAFESNDDDIQKIITQADKALYESKSSGRNRVTVYDEEVLGRKSIDKLTGLLMKKSTEYKLQQFHNNLRKNGHPYGVIVITLETLIVSEFAILDQYIKQTAAILKSQMRKEDIIGRYTDTKFLIISAIDESILSNVKERVETAMTSLSEKFDDLVIASVQMYVQIDDEVHYNDILKEIISQD